MPVGKFPEQITYWAPGERNDYGVADFAAPVVIMGRWEDTVKEFIDPQGDEQMSEAIAYMASAVVVNGYVMRGLHSDDSPLSVEGSKEIRQVATTRNLRYSDQENRAYL